MKIIRFVKILILVSLVLLSSCITYPNSPQNAKTQYECTNSCAAVGMNAVFSGNQCGCESPKK